MSVEINNNIINMIKTVNRIADIREDTVEEIAKCINNNEENIHYFIGCIEYLMSIRPLKRTNMIKLLNIICNKNNIPLPTQRKEIFSAGSVERVIADDNVDLFVRITDNPAFDPNNKLNAGIESPFFIVNDDIRGKVSYMQMMAFFGATKCFKFALASKMFNTEEISKYAIAGGNIEVIHLLEHMDISFDNCFEVAIKFHHKNICCWLLNNYKCESIDIQKTIEYYNEEMFFDLLRNADKRIMNESLISASKTNNIELIKYLIENKSADMETKDYFGRTPLRIAVEKDNLKIVQYFCENCKSNIETKDNKRRTLVHIAAERGNIEIIKYLVDKFNINVETENIWKETALKIAARKGDLKLAKFLIEKCNVDIEKKDDRGRTALHIAIENGFLHFVKFLIETCNADIESKTDVMNGEKTPLLIAVERGNIEMTKYLAKYANKEVKTTSGLTPRKIALLQGNTELLKCL